tara:strand:+ start:151 stop:495 length:345 start_codon:yes stop_codon:yes gene_type:complete
MFGLFDSKSEKAVKKIHKLIKEIWATGRRLCRKGPSNFWIKYLVDTEDHLEEVALDLIKLTDEKYLDNVVSILEKEYEKSPLKISDEHWHYVNDLTMQYRIQNNLRTTSVRWRF